MSGELLTTLMLLIDTLRNRYHQDKIILVGHSFGTYLGSIIAVERPDLIKAYISIGQVVDDERAKVLQETFIREKANSGNREDIITSIKST